MSSFAQRSFSKGEVSPELFARADTQAYAAGLRTARNVIVQRQGGVTARPGTEYLGTYSTGRVIPFVFNDTQAYCLVFTNNLVTVIQSGVVVTTVVTTYAAADVAAIRYTQSADTMTLVHPNYLPRQLKRTGASTWAIANMTFGVTTATPVGQAVVGGGAGLQQVDYVVTAISRDTGQESLPTAAASAINVLLPSAANNIQFTWTPSVLYTYNAYRQINGSGYGLIASGNITGLVNDTGITADYTNAPQLARTVFGLPSQAPAAVGYFQDRLLFGDTISFPYRVWTSQTGDYGNLSVHVPSQADDSIQFDLVSRKVNSIQHIIDAGMLILLTTGGEWVVNGDTNGVLTPSSVNARQYSEHGASALVPIRVDQRLLYVQARKSIVRDVGVDPSVQYSGFKGRDLTLFAPHLFDGYSLVDWAYAEVPHSIVWAARSDGKFLALTIVDDQGVLGWTRHDTVGSVLSMCAVPEGGEDRIYLLVQRTGGVFLERMRSLFFSDITSDACFLDAGKQVDGRNTSATQTMTLTGGSTWGNTELLTCTATGATPFASTDVSNAAVWVTSGTTTVRLTVTAFTSSSVVQGFVDATVPVSLRGVSTTAWRKAVSQLSGLSHLANQTVGVFGDGYVVGSPNNPAYPTLTVSSTGTLTLPKPYSVIWVGLPYTCDVQTLDLDVPQGGTYKSNALQVNRVITMINNTRGIFMAQTDVDPSTDLVGAGTGFVETKIREAETWGAPVSLFTGAIETNLRTTWSKSGRVFFRQVDPLPMTVLAIMPAGAFPPPG